MLFECTFTARLRNATGLSSARTESLSCEPDRVLPELYAKYDHIHQLRVTHEGTKVTLPEPRWLPGE